MPVLLEVCVDSVDALEAAIAGGADRIELCSALDLGGLTPTPGLIAAASRAPIPIYAMIRPHARSFVWTPADASAMLAEIDAVRTAGLAGVVLGAALPDGALDVALLEKLRAHATGLGATLHRVFDLVPDPASALEAAIALGFERVLTSGGAARAEEGLAALGALVRQSAGRIGIMAGSGVSAMQVARIVRESGVLEVHASCRETLAHDDARGVDLGFFPARQGITSVSAVQALKRALATLE
ncbi:copper homeostasis protein [Paraburkholderia bannensis]|jgi:copper homeostasis protein|uniref:PF03932 family protein CutC n=1 Tax=Paraburkholderia bannensis TaxID=765414 RepID=A0A7W9U5M6_9BURK|nr:MULTISPECIES: copper homeostasis protein CutC [Paraburkholderia]MBB3261423.1 copper homeostasis protein [Paraburkholderia sp. WP4_3_2]MBB6106385.1 copper homeostasis protein [Paraburkholderia bannensis]